MPDPRIIDIELDERSILKRNADIEQERRIAIFDLLERNHFAVAGHDGPYRVRLRVEEGRLAIELLGDDGDARKTLRMGLARLRRPIRSYYRPIRYHLRNRRPCLPGIYHHTLRHRRHLVRESARQFL